MSIDSEVFINQGSASLSDVWPETGRKLAAMLRARKVEAWIADDIIQEVALRVLQARPSYSNSEDLYPWAATVARNLHVSHIRANRKFRDLDGATDVATHGEVATQVEWRLALASVVERIGLLPESDRRALAAGLAGYDSGVLRGPEPGRVTVRRHRVRRRLRAAAQGVLAAGAWIWNRRTKSAAGVSMPAVVAVAAVQMLMAVGPAFSQTEMPSGLRALGNAEAAAAKNATSTTGLQPHEPVVFTQPFRAQPFRAQASATSAQSIASLQRGGRGIRVTSRPARPGDALLCLHDLPTVGALCTPSLGKGPTATSAQRSTRQPVLTRRAILRSVGAHG